MSDRVFADRVEAGRLLGKRLETMGPFERAVVLALPRGGVPVAFEVAQKLGLPLDLLIVRKLGAPGQEELAMGAIATGNALVYNDRVLRGLGVSDEEVERVTRKERAELERRERLYRGDRPTPELDGRTIILVDDGLATGSTMRAAITAIRQTRPARIIVAAGVAPPETVAALGEEADDVVCISTPSLFMGVGQWFQDFSQTTDEEVRALLDSAWNKEAAPS